MQRQNALKKKSAVRKVWRKWKRTIQRAENREIEETVRGYLKRFRTELKRGNRGCTQRAQSEPQNHRNGDKDRKTWKEPRPAKYG